MFANKTAWFSESCAAEASTLWVEHGGKLEVSSLAQFIFSEDWDHNDTKGFLTSTAYLKQHLAVFTSRYVLDAVKDGLDYVSVGSYLLVPAHVQQRLSGCPRNSLPHERNLRSQRNKVPQDLSTTDSAHPVLYLPHTSGQVSGTIGSPPSVQAQAQARLGVCDETHIPGSVTVSAQAMRKSPWKPREVTKSLNNVNSRNASPHKTKAGGSQSQLEGSSHQAASSRPGLNQVNGIASEREISLYDDSALANIVHVKDLPKATNRLRTIHAKGTGVVIRTKTAVS